jgi:nicotinate-nucleotide adenylyltransferase
MRVGIFGGTFDPPHLGHLILADEALHRLDLERLFWVLTPDPPHKQGQPISSWQQRYKLVQAAIAGNPSFEISRIDIDRPGPHYAVETVKLFKELMPAGEMFYLMGGDSLHDLPGWYKPEELVRLCAGFGVMHRPDDAIDLTHLEVLLPGISAKIFFIDAPLLEISSSEIRERASSGQPFRYFLSPAVYDVIQSERYYA